MRRHPRQGQLHRHRLTSPPKPHCGASTGPVKWVRNLSVMRRTHTTASPAAGRNIAVTLRGQGLRCLEARSCASVDTVKNTTEELRIINAQYAIGNEAAQLHPAPSSSGEASPDIIIQDAREGAKGGKKRHKQCCQETAPTAADDDGNNKQAGSSGVVCAVATIGSGKCQARLPTDHFEKLLEETCPNHTYLIKHKLRDCSMMKNLMALGSLTQGMEVNEVPDEGNTTPFLGEDVVMMKYNGRPSPGMCCASNPSLGAPAHCSWEGRNVGM
jgi:hypothetical protein